MYIYMCFKAVVAGYFLAKRKSKTLAIVIQSFSHLFGMDGVVIELNT